MDEFDEEEFEGEESESDLEKNLRGLHLDAEPNFEEQLEQENLEPKVPGKISLEQKYYQMLEKIVDAPENKIRKKLKKGSNLSYIAAAFVSMQKGELSKDIREFSTDSRVATLSLVEEVWFNDSMIQDNLFNALEETEGIVKDQQIVNIKTLCEDTILKLDKLKNKPDLLLEHNISDPNYIPDYKRQFLIIKGNVKEYLQLMEKLDDAIELDRDKEMLIRDKRGEFLGIKRDYKPQEALNLRLDMIYNAYGQISRGIEEKDERKVINAIRSLNSAVVEMNIGREYKGGDALISARHYVNDIHPEKINFFEHCAKSMVKEDEEWAANQPPKNENL